MRAERVGDERFSHPPRLAVPRRTLWFCQRSCHQVLPCRGESGGRSSGLQDAQHGYGSPEKEQSAAICGNVLVVAGAEAEEVAELIVAAAEPSGRSRALEAPAWAGIGL